MRDASPSRRAVLAGGSVLATSAALAVPLVGGVFASFSENSRFPMSGDSTEPDPVFAAIAAHSAVRERMSAIDSEHDDWSAVDAEELASWNALCASRPTTFTGLMAYAEHIAAYPDVGCLTGDDGLAAVIANVAAAARDLTLWGGAAAHLSTGSDYRRGGAPMRDGTPSRRALLKAGGALGTVAALAAALPVLPKAEAAEDDPLIGLIEAYRAGMVAYNADEDVGIGDDTYDRRREAKTWGPSYAVLTEAPPPARSFAGAIAAVRLVVDEEGETSEIHVPLLRAALAYLERHSREAVR